MSLLAGFRCNRFSSSPSSLSSSARATRCLYSTKKSSAPKPSVKLIAELRKHTDVSLTRARDALAASNNDIQAALQWLSQNEDRKVQKVAGRATKEGLVGISAISKGSSSMLRGAPAWAGIVELNCETDFVARNELFSRMLAEIAHTAAYFAPQTKTGGKGCVQGINLAKLLDAPLISLATGSLPPGAAPPTVSESIRSLMGKVGENISLRRAAAIKCALTANQDAGLRLAMYGHGGTHTHSQLPLSAFSEGRVAGMALLAIKAPQRRHLREWLKSDFIAELEELENALGRQLVGFPTTSIEASPENNAGEQGALYSQPFLMYPQSQGATVRAVLDKLASKRQLVDAESGEAGVEVVEFVKWSVGGESVEGKK